MTAALTASAVLLAFAAVPVAGRADTQPAAGCDRDPVVLALEAGGPAVQAAARSASLGTDADVCTFLSTPWHQNNVV